MAVHRAYNYLRSTVLFLGEYQLSVKICGIDYVNAQSAQQMAEVFPYILTSGVLKDVVAEDMGLDSMPGSIDVKADDGTNLLTISVCVKSPWDTMYRY